MKDGILIVDFGSQYTQLIARRLREGGYYSYILSCNNHKELNKFNGKGIILAGSHRSTTTNDEEALLKFINNLSVPILGICYGMQLLARIYGGQVHKGTSGEYGRSKLEVLEKSILLGDNIKDVWKDVWMSHGDEVRSLPQDFICTARSDDGIIAAFENPAKSIYALQFHPEVSHTPGGSELLCRFASDISGCANSWVSENIVESIVEDMQQRINPQDKALIALSGGVDSTVATVLVQKVFGRNIVPILIDNGLLRKNEAQDVVNALRELDIKVVLVDAAEIFLAALKGITDPEQKRKIIGKLFIDLFEEHAKKVGGAQWLVQGTIYPDVIESSGNEASVAQVIKSHHNVGGLPETMTLPLLEPLRMLFKDEVRKIGSELGIPHHILGRHPFPGPGLAVRILGEVKEEYLEILRDADYIFIDELRKSDHYNKISQAFCVFIPVKSVGVIGDARSYGYVICLRAVVTMDFMTAESAIIPNNILTKISSRIMNEITSVSRVVFDYSSKPPATIEWE